MKKIKRKRLPLLFIAMILTMCFAVTAAYTSCKAKQPTKQYNVHGYPKQIA